MSTQVTATACKAAVVWLLFLSATLAIAVPAHSGGIEGNSPLSAQAEPLADIQSLEQYTEWMKGLLTFMSDAGYEIKSFATDDERKSVCAYAVFFGTHTGKGGPCPPTCKRTAADYVYVMEFDGDKIRHMTKIWNAPWTMKELGWA